MEAHRTRRIKRDYHALNDGTDEEEGSTTQSFATFEPMTTQQELDCLPSSSQSLAPADSVSQIDLSTSADCSLLLEDDGESSPGPRNMRSTSWVWTFFDVTTLEGNTYRDGRTGKEKPNRKIMCKQARCSWYTTDSKRITSTSNMTMHLLKAHGITNNHFRQSLTTSASEETLDVWVEAKPKIAPQAQLEQNVIRWIVKETIPFTTIESPAFQRVRHLLFHTKQFDTFH